MPKDAMPKHAPAGSLTLVGTPIGNRADLSGRALEALRTADTVLAEDTRVSGKLLQSFGIAAHLERCDENVIAGRAPQLVARMAAGERMAFVSDAGMPAVADPGARLVDAARDAGVEVDVIPGPSAVTCAIAQSGFACEAFYFGGFLPRKTGEQARVLRRLAGLPAVLVFYESPHRVAASLESIASVFPQRRVALARELTKVFQEVVRGSARELCELLEERGEPKGECVLLVDAPSSEELAAWERRMAALELGVGLAGGGAGSKGASAGDTGRGEGASPDAAKDGGAFDLDGAIRAGLAAGKRATALAKELARCCEVPRPQIYERICELGKEG